LALLPGTEAGVGVVEAHRQLRAVVLPLVGDREPGPDFAAALALVRGGRLATLADPAAG
jgi:hypothetical protein